MSSETLITADSVSKKFCKSLKRSLLYGLTDVGRELVGLENRSESLRDGEFWAVKDVSLKVKRGEVLGIIGSNGAGKTTLLRLLSGLIKPDHGRIEVRGRVGAMIALGVGFNPVLTGRENVYASGALLGLKTSEIEVKYPSIVDYSELSEFMEMPVQNYSSGMRVRLGFAVASQLDPDVLLLDEILAVGDVAFRAKCINSMLEMANQCASIFISHNMAQISRICTSVMVLGHGECVYYGDDVGRGIELCSEQNSKTYSCVVGGENVKLCGFDLESEGGAVTDEVLFNKEMTVHLDLEVDRSIEATDIHIIFVNQEQQNIMQCSSHIAGVTIRNEGAPLRISIGLGKISLNPGIYDIEVTVTKDNFGEVLYKHRGLRRIKIKGERVGYAPLQLAGEWNVQRMPGQATCP